MSNYQLLNAMLYVTENDCKLMGLPEKFGNWHTVYVRMNRWSKSGVIKRLFEALQTGLSAKEEQKGTVGV